MEKTGEQFIPTQSQHNEVIINLERYLYAMHHLDNKVVLDVGCGAGLGTYLYSLVAKKVYAVDHSKSAIDYAKMYPHMKGKVEFIEGDLTKMDLPEHEVTVALEFLEHIDDPKGFLGKLKSDELIFSVPLHSMEVSDFHKYEINTVQDVKDLIENNFSVDQYHTQYDTWVYGRGIRFE